MCVRKEGFVKWLQNRDWINASQYKPNDFYVKSLICEFNQKEFYEQDALILTMIRYHDQWSVNGIITYWVINLFLLSTRKSPHFLPLTGTDSRNSLFRNNIGSSAPFLSQIPTFHTIFYYLEPTQSCLRYFDKFAKDYLCKIISKAWFSFSELWVKPNNWCDLFSTHDVSQVPRDFLSRSKK